MRAIPFMRGCDGMNGNRSPKSRMIELVKYFGFAIISVIVFIVAFLVISNNIAKEIHLSTYQALEDSTRQESASLQKYLDSITARTALIATYKADAGPNMLIAALRTELRGTVKSDAIGFANHNGDIVAGEQAGRNVSAEDWFQKSMDQTEQIFLVSQSGQDEQMDLLVSAPVPSENGTSGVLFVMIDGNEISDQISKAAYHGRVSSFICDSDGTVLFCEPRMSVEYTGKTVFDIADHIVLQDKSEADDLAAALKQEITVDFSYRHHDGVYYAIAAPAGVLDWRIITFVSGQEADAVLRRINLYLMSMLLIMLAVGSLMTVRAYLHEMATVKNLESDKELLRQSTQRYKLITQLSNEVLFQVDLQSGAISFNDNFEGMFGFPPPNCSIHQIESCLPLFVEADQQRFISMINFLRAGGSEAREELRMFNSRGVVRWKQIEIYTIFDQEGQSKELVGKIVDIHRQKQSMQRLVRQADSEPLTGLFNRGAMERNVKAFLTGEGLSGKHALLMMDIDNFKTVNDTLGHTRGDDLLVSFASVIRRVFRAGDYSSRIGGDEYMVFVRNVFDDGIALEKAEALRREMAALSNKIGVSVSVSVGIALYSRDGNSFEKLYKAADQALYYVKNDGKNAVAFFSALGRPEAETE